MNDIEAFESKYKKEEKLEKLEWLRKSKEYIGKTVNVKIDRPLGSKPIKEYPNFIYELNYGFIPNTISGDGEELDCYILGIDKPITEFTGRCIAIIHRLNEIDDKLIVVPENEEYPIENIEKLTYFSEKFHKSIVLK